MEEMREEKIGFSSDNEGYTNANVLQIRLDTEPILTKTELFLRGERIKYTIRDGEPIAISERVGRPKANDQGVHSIMMWMANIINPQTVQGNLEDFIELSNYKANIRLDLTSHMMINRIDWNIDKKDFEGIIDLIVTEIGLFLSRLVKNEERKSFFRTITHNEQSNSEVRGKGYKIPGL